MATSEQWNRQDREGQQEFGPGKGGHATHDAQQDDVADRRIPAGPDSHPYKPGCYRDHERLRHHQPVIEPETGVHGCDCCSGRADQPVAETVVKLSAGPTYCRYAYRPGQGANQLVGCDRGEPEGREGTKQQDPKWWVARSRFNVADR